MSAGAEPAGGGFTGGFGAAVGWVRGGGAAGATAAGGATFLSGLAVVRRVEGRGAGGSAVVADAAAVVHAGSGAAAELVCAALAAARVAAAGACCFPTITTTISTAHRSATADPARSATRSALWRFGAPSVNVCDIGTGVVCTIRRIGVGRARRTSGADDDGSGDNFGADATAAGTTGTTGDGRGGVSAVGGMCGETSSVAGY
jgi:hypothetical protein